MRAHGAVQVGHGKLGVPEENLGRSQEHVREAFSPGIVELLRHGDGPPQRILPLSHRVGLLGQNDPQEDQGVAHAEAIADLLMQFEAPPRRVRSRRAPATSTSAWPSTGKWSGTQTDAASGGRARWARPTCSGHACHRRDATLASPTSCARCATASQHDASAPPRIRASCGPSTRVSSWTTGSTEVRGAGWGARSARRRSSRRFSAPLPRSWRCRSGGPGVGAIGRVRGYAPLRDRLISHPPSTTPRCPHSSGAVAKSATTAATPPAVEAATVSCLKQSR